MAKDIGIYRVEYEIITSNNDISMWTAIVAATSPEDAELYIRNFVQRPIRVLVNGFLVKLDGISYEVRNILNNLNVVGKPAKPEKVNVSGAKTVKKDTTPKTLTNKTTV